MGNRLESPNGVNGLSCKAFLTNEKTFTGRLCVRMGHGDGSTLFN